jgi:soluble lytic murein transglycosylase
VKAALWIFLMTLLPALAAAEISPQNRQLYLQADKAMGQYRWSDVRQIRDQLANYPLAIYIDYYMLESRLRQVDGAEASAFMVEAQNTPLQIRFKDKYLRRAGRDRRWQDFLAVATTMPRDVELQCYYHRAQYSQGLKDEAWAGARHLWNHGESRPKACNPLFDAWMDDDQLDDDLIWSRMMKAVDERQGGLAQYVGKMGSPELAAWADTMMVMYRHPASLSQQKLLPVGEPHVRDILAHGFPRLARVDVDHALRLWKKYESRYSFSSLQLQKIQDSIAYYILLRDKDKHTGWLDDYLVSRHDDKLLERRLRWVVSNGEWANFLYLHSGLSERRQQANSWSYWSAVALSEMGKVDEAKARWKRLSGERDFYGFISAERLGLPYSLNHQPFVAAASPSILQHAGVVRASELIYHEQPRLAQSEWSYLLSGLDVASKEQLSSHAIDEGWYRLGIDAANHAEAWDRLELRFPAPYADVYSQYASQHGVPDTELLSISRRESTFYPDANSPVGAKGLMQLMPATARVVARRLGDQTLSGDLYNIENNVSLGSAYYKQLLDRYKGNRVFSLAAYNAGPQRVRAWRGKGENMDVYRWIESIPFRETREYVQGVLAYNVVYSALANTPVTLLNETERSASY